MGLDDALDSSGVYAIRCVTTGKAYVGSAVHLARRWRTHRAQLRRGNHHSQHLQRAWDKYGESAFVFQVIELTPKSNLIPCEQRHIDTLRACDPAVGYNMAPNAGNTLGVKLGAFTQEHRDKISAALRGRTLSDEHLAKIRKLNIGRPSPKKGKTLNLSADARMRMSIAKKGKKLSAEHVAKLVIAHTGAKRSDTARSNMSAARKGVPATERQLASIMETAQNRRKFSDAQVYEIKQRLACRHPVARIAEEFGCNPGTIYRIKNNERKVYL